MTDVVSKEIPWRRLQKLREPALRLADIDIAQAECPVLLLNCRKIRSNSLSSWCSAVRLYRYVVVGDGGYDLVAIGQGGHFNCRLRLR